MSEYHVVSCSGGKDSTALVIGMYERGMHIDEVIGCNEGYWWPEAVEAFNKVGEITGYKMTMLEPDESHQFDYLMYDKPITKGKREGEKGYGWPNMLSRWCTTFCKARVIDGYLAPLKESHTVIQYIGIAADEAQRTNKVAGVDMQIVKRYPLVDWGMTENDCLKFCYDRGITWNGLYKHFNRMSCWLCPLQGLKSIRSLYKYYPDKWEQLKAMDDRAFNNWKVKYSVRDLERRFELEDMQMCLFTDEELEELAEGRW